MDVCGNVLLRGNGRWQRSNKDQFWWVCGVAQCAIQNLTKSQTGWGWKGPLQVMISKLPAQAGVPRASCWRPCLHGFWISPRTDSTIPRAIFTSIWSPSLWRPADDFLVLYVAGFDFQSQFLYYLSRSWGEADQPVVPWVLLALLEDWSNICFHIVLMHFSLSL